MRGPAVFLAEYASQVTGQALRQNRFSRGDAGRVHAHLVKIMRQFWGMICEAQRLMRYSYPED